MNNRVNVLVMGLVLSAAYFTLLFLGLYHPAQLGCRIMNNCEDKTYDQYK